MHHTVTHSGKCKSYPKEGATKKPDIMKEKLAQTLQTMLETGLKPLKSNQLLLMWMGKLYCSQVPKQCYVLWDTRSQANVSHDRIRHSWKSGSDWRLVGHRMFQIHCLRRSCYHSLCQWKCHTLPSSQYEFCHRWHSSTSRSSTVTHYCIRCCRVQMFQNYTSSKQKGYKKRNGRLSMKHMW